MSCIVLFAIYVFLFGLYLHLKKLYLMFKQRQFTAFPKSGMLEDRRMYEVSWI